MMNKWIVSKDGRVVYRVGRYHSIDLTIGGDWFDSDYQRAEYAIEIAEKLNNAPVDDKHLIKWAKEGESIMRRAGIGFRLGTWWADRPWRTH